MEGSSLVNLCIHFLDLSYKDTCVEFMLSHKVHWMNIPQPDTEGVQYWLWFPQGTLFRPGKDESYFIVQLPDEACFKIKLKKEGEKTLNTIEV